ncbi:MAG: hypothetical protein ACKVU4_11380 [Phycisphaerales bacterium]
MPAQADPRGSGGGRLTRSLAGDLPCVRCRYNLRGLSVVTKCPECGTPVRATILAAVDPYASLLRPIPRRGITALGLLAWAFGALVAAALTWILRLDDLAGLDLSIGTTRRLVIASVAGIGVSGLGAIVFIRPHSGLPRRQVIAAIVGCAAYAGLAWVHGMIHGVYDAVAAAPFLQRDHADPERVKLRLAAGALMLVIVAGLRPNARLLAARSLLLREGRVDRQTMLAMAVVVGVGMVGDALHWASIAMDPAAAVYAVTTGTVLIAVSSMLLTLGLAGVVMDACRIAPVVLEPAPSFTQVFGDEVGRGPAGDRPAPAGDAPNEGTADAGAG